MFVLPVVLQYMAPEVLKNQPYTEKADVYSFAVCFWQLLSGTSPLRALACTC